MYAAFVPEVAQEFILVLMLMQVLVPAIVMALKPASWDKLKLFRGEVREKREVLKKRFRRGEDEAKIDGRYDLYGGISLYRSCDAMEK